VFPICPVFFFRSAFFQWRRLAASAREHAPMQAPTIAERARIDRRRLGSRASKGVGKPTKSDDAQEVMQLGQEVMHHKQPDLSAVELETVQMKLKVLQTDNDELRTEAHPN
jgi:hypothetical protein